MLATGQTFKMWTCSFIILICVWASNSLNLDRNYILKYNGEATGSNRSDYFGYTVLIYGDNHHHWIQVGAPRANNSVKDSVEPGMVYRCKLNVPCKPSLRDDSDNEGSWLGASMAIHASSETFICAPRWKDKSDPENWKMRGKCFITSTEDKFDDIVIGTKEPLVQKALNTFQLPTWSGSIHYYQLGEFGFSINIKDDAVTGRANVIIGAPGVLNWRGSSVLYKEKSKANQFSKRSIREAMTLKDAIVAFTLKTEKSKDWDYMGYSVDSGRFFRSNQTLYVMGAPRNNDLTGRVLIYQFSSKDKEPIRTIQSLFGKKFGGYFGAVIKVADLNHDGYDDLLVSELYSETPTVYIYVAGMTSLVEPSTGLKELRDSTQFGMNSMFGAAICVTDLDYDGYNDVIIGAPYADGGRGAIAIWSGGQSGPKGEGPPSFIIKASEFDDTLRGFGISIASSMDLDGNEYSDVAIGAHMSGNVVIFRGRPVVQLMIFIGTNSTIRLLYDTKSLKVPLCVNYTSATKILTDMKIELIVKIDHTFRRAYRAGKPGTYEYNEVADLKSKGAYCKDVEISMKEHKNNFEDPVIITANVKLVDYTNEMKVIVVSENTTDGFNKNYPVGEEVSGRLEIPFSKNCGDDDICSSDLSAHITTDIEMESFILGSANSIKFNITLRNKGEPAYLTRVRIYLPTFTSLANLPSICSISMDIVTCIVANPLRNEPKTIQIDIDVEEVTKNSKEMDKLLFKVEAITQSEEVNPRDNTFTFELPLTIEASLGINGKSLQDLYPYFKSEDNIIGEVINFKQLYEVNKMGISPIDEVQFTIDIPYMYVKGNKEFKFIAVKSIEVHNKGQRFLCPNANHLFSDDLSTQNLKRSKRETAEILAEAANTTVLLLPKNRTVIISCGDDNIHCVKIDCLLERFGKNLDSSRLIVNMNINISMIKDTLMGKKDILLTKTIGYANIISDRVELTNVVQTTVDTIFVSSPHVGKVDLWMIILAVVLGIIFLALLTYGLVRLGFFKRKTKEELELLKQEGKPHEANLMDIPEKDLQYDCDD